MQFLRPITDCLPRRVLLLHRYIFLETLTPFFGCVFVFTGILFLIRAMKLLQLIISKNVPVLDILMLFALIVPRFMEVAIPMSLLLGVVLAFSRLSRDSELIVMRASGISLRQLVVPIVAFSLATSAIALVLSLWIAPWANYHLSQGLFEIAKSRASSGLLPGTFNDFGPLTIYAEQVDGRIGRLENVLIADRRNPDLSRNFIAHHGSIISNDLEQTLTLRLYDGSIHEGAGLTYNVTYFDINNLNLSQDELVDENASDIKKSQELYTAELRHSIADLKNLPNPSKEDKVHLAKYKVELNRRFSLPVSCWAVGLLAMALGVQPNRGGRAWGGTVNILFGLAAIILYYFIFAIATALGEEAKIPAVLAMWGPNLLFFVLALYIFQQVGTERWMAVSEAFADMLGRISHRLKLSREDLTN